MDKDEQDMLVKNYYKLVDWLNDNGEKKQKKAREHNKSVEELNKVIKARIDIKYTNNDYFRKMVKGRIEFPDEKTE